MPLWLDGAVCLIELVIVDLACPGKDSIFVPFFEVFNMDDWIQYSRSEILLMWLIFFRSGLVQAWNSI